MVGLHEFVNALLEGIITGRGMSDGASARVAQQYLKHDLLKGFPIPRMKVAELEAELQFAVASPLVTQSTVASNEIGKNISYRIQYLLLSVANNPSIKGFFSKKKGSRQKWNDRSIELSQSLDAILSNQDINGDLAVDMLSLSVQNFFYAIAIDCSAPELLTEIGNILVPESNQNNEHPLTDAIAEEIKKIVNSVPTIDDSNIRRSPELTDSLPGLNILVTASELEGLDASQVQKLKLVCHAGDRKWIKKDGGTEEPTYILDRE